MSIALKVAFVTLPSSFLNAANKLGLTGKKVNIHFKNGTLHIELAKDKHIIMTGTVSSIKNISLKI